MEVFGTLEQSISDNNLDESVTRFDIVMGFYDDLNNKLFQQILLSIYKHLYKKREVNISKQNNFSQIYQMSTR